MNCRNCGNNVQPDQPCAFCGAFTCYEETAIPRPFAHVQSSEALAIIGRHYAIVAHLDARNTPEAPVLAAFAADELIRRAENHLLLRRAVIANPELFK